jgi:predicted nucleic acid-binding protein
MNIYLLDALAGQARSTGLNVSTFHGTRSATSWRTVPRPQGSSASGPFSRRAAQSRAPRFSRRSTRQQRRWASTLSREDSAVVDSSLVVDFVMGIEGGTTIGDRIGGLELCAPTHNDAEVLSAFCLIEPGGLLSTEQADLRRRAALEVPVWREFLADLAPRAWARRPTVRLADALRIELASRLDMSFLNTDARLARAVPTAGVIAA